jgi:hypothetical protein
MHAIIPVDFGAKMIVSMNHLVNRRVDGMLLGAQMIGAQQNLHRFHEIRAKIIQKNET